VQHKNPTSSHYDTAWTLSAIYFFITALTLVILTPTIAEFYKIPQLINILHILAVGLVLKGLTSARLIDLQKYFRFRKEATLNITVKIIGFVTTISLAFHLRNYWALLFGMLTSQFANMALSYVIAPYKPRITLSKTRELFSFSSWLLLSNLIRFANTKSTELIIGKVLGIKPLGLYTIGENIASMATYELSATINRAAYPGYAKASSSKMELKRIFLRVFSVIAATAFPLGIGFYSIAYPFTYVILGEKWMSAIPILQIIAISGAISSLQSNLQYVFFSLGKPRLLTVILLFRAIIFLPLIYILSVRYNIIGAAYATLISTCLMLPLNAYFIQKLLPIRITELARHIWRPLLSATTMAAALRIAETYTPMRDMAPNAFSLAILVISGAAVYCAALLFNWVLAKCPKDGIEHIAITWLRGQTQK
jgi:O-antigen/teichoic acid export membrane protein